MTQPTDIANPLLSHLDFVKYTLRKREDNDTAFRTKLNDQDFEPGVIFFHGVHALFRCVALMKNSDLSFRDIDMPRKKELNTTDELLTLYEEAISSFVNELEKLDLQQLEEEIPSPLSGKPVVRKKWFAQTVMHTIHHVGQAVRLQGIVYRKQNNIIPSFETASDYTDLYS